MHYYEVAPTKIIRANTDSLTYHAEQVLPVGTIVSIPVGKKNNIGIILRKTSRPEYQTKTIDHTVETIPIPQALLETLQWISAYYATPLATVLQVALPRGIEKKRRLTKTTANLAHPKAIPYKLTDDQEQAIHSLDTQSVTTTLLHGVTGSGKTAVYIDQAKKVLKSGKSVLILVPEIALTSQLVSEFSRYFEDVIVTHSHQTEAERHTTWRNILTNQKPQIIIGPRSALFMPMSTLGLIVIDEMHEPSYKQEQSPRYSALRVASILGKRHRAKVIMGSATPLVTDYYLARQTDQPIITMKQLAKPGAIVPAIDLVDMTKKANFTKHRFISNTLFTQIQTVLASGKQVLLFHNRRGSAPITLCNSCGWQAGCPRCYTPLTLHADKHLLQCHICGFTDRVPTSCPVCHEASIIHKGIGTKLIESEIKKLFPSAKIGRFDGDVTKEQSVNKRFTELYRGDIDIIIGTQVVAKGLNLPELRLVGVIQADAGLSLPDYGASERTFELLAQVIGRVGRSSHTTHVVVQSFQPTHPAITFGLAQDYAGFYAYCLKLRKQASFPPFTFISKLTCIYKTEAATIKNAKQLANQLKTVLPSTVTILGPTPSFYERQHDTYRWQLILKSTRRADLITALSYVPTTHWQFELDPQSLL